MLRRGRSSGVLFMIGRFGRNRTEYPLNTILVLLSMLGGYWLKHADTSDFISNVGKVDIFLRGPAVKIRLMKIILKDSGAVLSKIHVEAHSL